MNIYNLIIEVTRRCNISCKHCLRGPQQKLDIDLNFVDTLFSKVEYISSITFSGGEPSLVPDIINEIIELARKYNVSIGNFYIATNAKRITNDFIDCIQNLYDFCCENEISSVNYSNDYFHKNETVQRGIRKLEENFDFVGPKDSKEYPLTYDRVIAEGRAKNWEVDKKNKLEKFDFYDENDISEGNLYLNCKGFVIAGCDWSYHSQDENDKIICHVNDFCYEKVVEYDENVRKVEEYVCD